MAYSITIKPIEGVLPILHPILRAYHEAGFEASE